MDNSINEMLEFFENENEKSAEIEIAETFGFWGEADDACSWFKRESSY